jgi:hypothetical protein
MRSSWCGLVVVLVSLGGCECGAPGLPDGGGGGAGGGGDMGVGGGGGGSDVDSGVDSDAGPRRIGCEVDAGSIATPECTPASSGCQSATDCPTGLCLKLATGGVCTHACGDAGACEPTWSCQRRWTGAGNEGFCVPARRTP